MTEFDQKDTFCMFDSHIQFNDGHLVSAQGDKCLRNEIQRGISIRLPIILYFRYNLNRTWYDSFKTVIADDSHAGALLTNDEINLILNNFDNSGSKATLSKFLTRWNNTGFYLSLAMRNPAFSYAKTKTQINCAADQRLCFRYTDSTIPLIPKSVISSLLLSSVAVQPGLCRKPRRPGFSQRGLFYLCSLFSNHISRR